VAVLTLYRIVDLWGNVDFLLTKIEWLRATSTGLWAALLSGLIAVVTSLNWNVVQLVLYLAGIGWILLTSAPRSREPEQLPLPEAPPAPKPRDLQQLKQAVARLLLKRIEHGETLAQGGDEAAMERWDRDTQLLVMAIWGEEARARYADERGYHFYRPVETIALRLERLRDLGRRLDFDDPPIVPDFDPEYWGRVPRWG
jgi:hypothetical protein